ncbi:MAG TPA: M15 family metallopeptidase, partial [Saprospiraceae bacterium]|nr:M15 family metallopeptidase [Saprospiraceae bacterium]
TSCKPSPSSPEPLNPNINPSTASTASTSSTIDYDSTQWTELTPADSVTIDLRYATTNNFVKAKMYPCARCFFRKEAADALKHINRELRTKGYQLKFFDCYRPRPVQQRLWDKVPNPDYVADPAKGSMHNRGAAADLTITDLNGKEINMGTTYDFFGPEAHQDYMQLPDPILAHRKLLTSAMEAGGFQRIRTEWWHFDLQNALPPLAEWEWECK